MSPTTRSGRRATVSEMLALELLGLWLLVVALLVGVIRIAARADRESERHMREYPGH